MSTFDIIFDNGGGATLQTPDYCHFFSDSCDAAEPVSDLLEPGATPDYWDGNEPEHRVKYDPDTIGYTWASDADLIVIVGDMTHDERLDWLEGISSRGERDFWTRLFSLRDAAYLLSVTNRSKSNDY
jgi:hypothetical protein